MPDLTLPRQHAARRRRTYASVLTGSVVLVVAALAGVAAALGAGPPAGSHTVQTAAGGPAGADLTTMPTPADDADASEPAAPVLRQMAAQLADGAADPYSYTDTRTWSAQPPTTETGNPVMGVRRIQHWQTADGADGRHIGAAETATGCHRVRARASATDAAPTLQTVAAQLLRLTGGGTTDLDDLLTNVTGLADQHAQRRDVRAAVLQVLAAQPGLRARQHSRDAAGRAGVDVFVDLVMPLDTPVRHTLTFSATTGELLANALLITGPSTGAGPDVSADDLALARALFPFYRLYLDSRFTASTTVPQDSCPDMQQRPTATPTAAKGPTP